MRTSNKQKWIAAATLTLCRYEAGLFTGSCGDCALCRVTADVADPENCGLCLMRIAKYIDNNQRPCVHMLTYPHTTFNVILRIEFWKRAIPMLEAMPSHRFERKVIAKKAVAFPELWALDKCVKYENPSPHSW